MGLLVESDSAKINYELFLCNNTNYNQEFIVFVHGLGMDSRYWYKIIPLLRENFNLVTFDLRGHGESTEGEDVISWDIINSDIINLIGHLKITYFHIIGHGIGANIAIQFSYHYPDFIKTLTIISSTVYYPSKAIDEIITYRKQLLDYGSLNSLANYLVPKLLINSTNNSDIDLLHSCYNNTSANKYLEYLDLIYDVLSLEKVSKIEIPTLIITGEFDPIFPPRLAGIFTFAFRNNHYVIIPNSSNTPILDQPVITSQKILQFIFEDYVKTKRHDIVMDMNYEKLGTHMSQVIEANLSEMQPQLLEVQLMDTFSVKYNGKEINEGWNQRNAKRLFCYLIFHRSVTREQVCDDLISEVDLNTAKRNLRVYLHHLKRLINIGDTQFLQTDNENIYLTGDLNCDLVKYINDIKDLENKDVTTYYEDFIRILKNAPKNILLGIFDEWALTLQKNVQKQLIQIAEKVAKYHTDRNELSKAAEFIELVIDYEYAEDYLYLYLIDLYTKTNQTKKLNYWNNRYHDEIIR